MSAWFELQDFEDERHRRFLSALQTHYERWRTMGLDENHIWAIEANGILTVAVDISDRECNLAMRTLRTDFRGNEVIVGEVQLLSKFINETIIYLFDLGD